MKILVIEDSRTLRNIQRDMLHTLGYSDVLEASNAAEAMALLAEQRPDLVLVDSEMPRIDGIAIIRKVRASDKQLPIIMVSAESGRSRVLEAVRAGVSNYVLKPFTSEVLANRIRQTMTRAAAGAMNDAAVVEGAIGTEVAPLKASAAPN